MIKTTRRKREGKKEWKRLEKLEEKEKKSKIVCDAEDEEPNEEEAKIKQNKKIFIV